LKLISETLPVTCGIIVTELYASTLPVALISTGTLRSSALLTVIGVSRSCLVLLFLLFFTTIKATHIIIITNMAIPYFLYFSKKKIHLPTS